MEKCEAHEQLIIAMTRMEGKLDNVSESLEKNVSALSEIITEHVKESVPIRDTVKSNDRFCKGAIHALWIMFVSIVGLAIKAIFQ